MKIKLGKMLDTLTQLFPRQQQPQNSDAADVANNVKVEDLSDVEQNLPINNEEEIKPTLKRWDFL